MNKNPGTVGFAAGVGAIFLLVAGVAEATPSVLVATIDGNDCAGVFGKPPDCVAEYKDAQGKYIIDPTPLIAKFDFDFTDDDDETGGFTTTFTAGNYASITGGEFSFTPTGKGIGTWTYTPGAGDPLITAFVAKGGSNFNLFSYAGTAVNGVYSGSWQTPVTCGRNNNQCGTSHLSFYNGGVKMPEPATLTLMGLGLLGAGFARRRACS
ncbi:MAG: PEP-CTERM sorting domain-containing protein [Chromatiales bacterium]|jgi:hypothetical protein|nr:PEP-CTERM sorting domain-containing protein [Chromatiales bacterium]